MTQQQTGLGTFDSRLTTQDEKNIQTFRTLLKMDGVTEFSADDFRRYGLDRFIKDTQHGLGSFFLKLKKNGLAVAVGFRRSEFASNHGHTIRVYKWTEKKNINEVSK